jgi:hypothetical protein
MLLRILFLHSTKGYLPFCTTCSFTIQLHSEKAWIPAFAGMTPEGFLQSIVSKK